MSTVEQRTPLSRDRIANAALALIDNDGLGELTMRKLGADLDVEAMSLYNHVSNKSDLLAAIGDQLSLEILSRAVSSSDLSWQARAEVLGLAWWDVAMAHPAAFTLVADEVSDSETAARNLCAAFDIFSHLGLDDEATSTAFHAAASYVLGAIRQELTIYVQIRKGRGLSAATLPADLQNFSVLTHHCSTRDGKAMFLDGLMVLIAGIESWAESVPQ
jgi:AcrR family transcriptional regulator